MARCVQLRCHANAHHLRVERGVSAAVMKDHLGHSSLSTTNAYLQQLTPAEVIGLAADDDWTGE